MSMFAFSQSQATEASSAAATASPSFSYQDSPSPPPGKAKRQIPHEDRELSEIKRRMWGLRVHCEGEGALAGVPEEEAAGPVVGMESDEESSVEAEGEGLGEPMVVRSDSQESTGSSQGSVSGRIGEDDPRALMLRALYQRRREAPKDKVEAKIESLIRASLRRATAASGSSGGLPLALCDAPWREVEEGRRGVVGVGNGGDMDTSPDPSDTPDVPPSPVLGLDGGLGEDDAGGMDL